MRKKLTVFLALALIIATITSCSSGDVQQTDAEKTTDATVSTTNATVTTTENSLTTTENDANSEFLPPELVKSEYVVSESSVGNRVSYALQIKNPNPNHAIQFPTIYITAKDENGKVLTEEQDQLMSLAAGETITYGNAITYKGDLPETVEFSVDVKETNVTYLPQESSGIIYAKDLSVENVTVEDISYTTKYSADVTNNSDIDMHAVSISIIYRKDGNLAGSERELLLNLNAGETKSFSIYSVIDKEEYDSYEIYVIPMG